MTLVVGIHIDSIISSPVICALLPIPPSAMRRENTPESPRVHRNVIVPGLNNRTSPLACSDPASSLTQNSSFAVAAFSSVVLR